MNDKLYPGVAAITAFFALIVVAFVAYSAIKYRDDTGNRLGAPITGWMSLELGWLLIPLVVSIGIFAWAAIMFFR